MIRDAILRPLTDFNAEKGYLTNPQLVAITLTGDDGAVIGGLWGNRLWLALLIILSCRLLCGAKILAFD
jgi:hypothetical protein